MNPTAINPIDRGIIQVGVRIQMKIAIVLGQSLQLQAAIDQDLVSFADLRLNR